MNTLLIIAILVSVFAVGPIFIGNPELRSATITIHGEIKDSWKLATAICLMVAGRVLPIW